jgi:hypothetical protein
MPKKVSKNNCMSEKEKLESILEQDKSIDLQILNAKKLYYNKLTRLDINVLETLKSNYEPILELFKIFDSAEKFNGYMEYLKQIEINKNIECFAKLCEDDGYAFAKPMISQLENVIVQVKPSTFLGGETDFYEICLKFNNFEFVLRYEFCDKIIEHESINFHDDGYSFKEELEEVMDYFSLPKSKIESFCFLMIDWLGGFSRHSLTEDLSEKYDTRDYLDKPNPYLILDELIDTNSNDYLIAKQLIENIDKYNIEFSEYNIPEQLNSQTCKSLIFNNYIIELSYNYHYENMCVWGGRIKINGFDNESKLYNIELNKIMKFYKIDKKYISEFNQLLIKWILSCGTECENSLDYVVEEIAKRLCS